MHLPRSAALVPRLDWVDYTDSTNDDLSRFATGAEPTAWPDLSVFVTDDQRAGRGRLGRVWSAPAGSSLAISVLLRPVAGNGEPLPMESYGWLPLMAGLAMARTVHTLGADAGVKWPNDVLIDGHKVCGVLAELLPVAVSIPLSTAASAHAPLPAPAGAVVGAGVNLTLERDNLPVDTATSLVLAGIPNPDPDVVLATYLTELVALYRDFLATGGDATAAAPAVAIAAAAPAVAIAAAAPAALTASAQPPVALRDAVRDACETIGRAVRVQLPGGDTLIGTAVDIDDTGRLVVEANGRRTAVSAGDVTHLRY